MKHLGYIGLSLLVLSGCDDGQPSTGAAELEVLESHYRYRTSDDPGFEVLRLTHSGAMSGVVTTYSLYGDGRLVWRWMAWLAPGSPRLEMFEGLHVTHRAEGRLTPDEMADLISIPVNYDLATTTTRDLLSQMGVSTWQATDAGNATLDLHLEKRTKWGLPLRPLDHSIRISDPIGTARRFPDVRALQGFVKLSEALNKNLKTPRMNESPAPGIVSGPGGRQTYSLRSDPDTKFISMTHPSGGWARDTVDVYNDGRVNYSIDSQHPDKSRTFQTSIPPAEVDELLRIIVDSGVMQHDHAKAKLAYPRNPQTSDPRIYPPSLQVHFTIQLAEDNCPGREPKSPITARVTSFPLRADRHPEVSELQAMAGLYRRLDSYRQIAKQSPMD